MAKFGKVFYWVILITVCRLLTACGGGETTASNNTDGVNNSNPVSQIILSGSVGDGPIINATIEVRDSQNTLLTTTKSDSTANYTVAVNMTASYPLTIKATEGIDLVTGAPPTFAMTSVVMGTDHTTANINPYSTLIVKVAQAMAGGLTQTNLNLANQIVLDNLNFGLDITQVPNPVTTPITEQNVATIVKGSEVLAETIRRTHTALIVIGNNTSQDQLFEALAADMTDGLLDGLGTTGTEPLLAATFNVVSGQVLIEALSNNLIVNGAWAADLLDQAILSTVPTATQTTADLLINTEILEQAKTAVAVAQAIAPSAALSTVASLLDSLTVGMDPASVEALLPRENSNDFDQAITLIVLATDIELQNTNKVIRDSKSNKAPIVSLAADPATVDYNGSTMLTWASTNAVTCTASGNWSGSKAISGSVIIGPLTSDSTYILTCVNSITMGTSISIPVYVNQLQNSLPTAVDDFVSANEATAVNINVLDNDADLNDGPITVSILDMPTNGTATVQADNTVTYTPNVNYSGTDNMTYRIVDINGDSAIAVVTIDVICTSCNQNTVLTLSWNPNPDEILGYIVYTGTTVDTATTEITDIPINSTSFDPLAPSIEYNIGNDLGLVIGDTVCFRVAAYNSVGISNSSESMCTTI